MKPTLNVARELIQTAAGSLPQADAGFVAACVLANHGTAAVLVGDDVLDCWRAVHDDAFDAMVDVLGVDEDTAWKVATKLGDTTTWLVHQAHAKGRCELVGLL